MPISKAILGGPVKVALIGCFIHLYGCADPDEYTSSALAYHHQPLVTNQGIGIPESWRSSLYPHDWTPAFEDDQGRFLHDFSYAGYHRGEREIPSPPITVYVTDAPYNADKTGQIDARNAIQSAIDYVGNSGEGGVVYLPAGTYRVNALPLEYVLKIRKSGVVLRGAGANKTYLFLDWLDTVNQECTAVDGECYHNLSGKAFIDARPCDKPDSSSGRDYGGSDWRKTLHEKKTKIPKIRCNQSRFYFAGEIDFSNLPTDGNGEAYLPKRSTRIPLVSEQTVDGTAIVPVENLSVGDHVIVRNKATGTYLERIGTEGHWEGDEWISDDGWWKEGDGRLRPTLLREIVAIEGNDIIIDIPTRIDMYQVDRAQVVPADDMLEEVGVEDLTIGMREHPDAPGGANPHGYGRDSVEKVKQCGSICAKKANGFNAIRYAHVANSWIQRVNTYRPASNKAYGFHLVSGGIGLRQTKNVTVRDSRMAEPQNERGADGNMFSVEGVDNLIDNCEAVSGRHNFQYHRSATSGNVMRNSKSFNSRLSNDYHMQMSTANLVENFTVETGKGWSASYRTKPVHYFTSTQNVFWNMKGIDIYNDRSLVASQQLDWGVVVGTSGNTHRVSNGVMKKNMDTSPQDYVEGVGMGETLYPQSLYADQLARRLNNGTLPIAATAVSIQAEADTYIRGGQYANDEYGDETALWVKGGDSKYGRRAFFRFDLSGIDFPVASAGLYLRAKVSEGGKVKRVNVRVRGMCDDDWTDTSASATPTWNDPPGTKCGAQPSELNEYEHLYGLAGYEASELMMLPTYGWHRFDVTEFVQAQYYGDKKASFAVVQDNSQDKSVLVRISSREAGSSYRPYLLVDGPRKTPLTYSEEVLIKKGSDEKLLLGGTPLTADSDVAVEGNNWEIINAAAVESNDTVRIGDVVAFRNRANGEYLTRVGGAGRLSSIFDDYSKWRLLEYNCDCSTGEEVVPGERILVLQSITNQKRLKAKSKGIVVYGGRGNSAKWRLLDAPKIYAPTYPIHTRTTPYP